MLSAWKALQSVAFGNRVRSARKGDARTMCLEFSCKREQSCMNCRVPPKISKKGTTPQDKATGVLPSRQKLYLRLLPRTSSPVTVASLRTAFQAVASKIECLYLHQKFGQRPRDILSLQNYAFRAFP